MILYGKTKRSQLAQVSWAGVHVEDTLAGIALKVVMVRMAHQLIPWVLSRQFHAAEFAIQDQSLDIPVDGCDAQSRHLALCGITNFLR